MTASETPSQSVSRRQRRKCQVAAPFSLQESPASAFVTPRETAPDCDLPAEVFPSDSDPPLLHPAIIKKFVQAVTGLLEKDDSFSTLWQWIGVVQELVDIL